MDERRVLAVAPSAVAVLDGPEPAEEEKQVTVLHALVLDMPLRGADLAKGGFPFGPAAAGRPCQVGVEMAAGYLPARQLFGQGAL